LIDVEFMHCIVVADTVTCINGSSFHKPVRWSLRCKRWGLIQQRDNHIASVWSYHLNRWWNQATSGLVEFVDDFAMKQCVALSSEIGIRTYVVTH
jgi:hypothetical protein